jgi:hypothetical protein
MMNTINRLLFLLLLATAGTTLEAQDPIFELHNTGSIWQFTGQPCSSGHCPGWKLVDSNPHTVSITATQDTLYQIHDDQSLWGYYCLSLPCSWATGSFPPALQVVANFTQLLPNRNVYQDNFGLTQPVLDENPQTKEIAIQIPSGGLHQLRFDGSIWEYTGTPCSGSSCPGWVAIDRNPTSASISAYNALYQVHTDGSIWRFTGTRCTGSWCPGWQPLNNDFNTKMIAVYGDQLVQLRNDGSIWKYTGKPCVNNSCPGWENVDNDPNTQAIAVNSSTTLKLRSDGSLWQYVSTKCSPFGLCFLPYWQQIDNNPQTISVVTDLTWNSNAKNFFP